MGSVPPVLGPVRLEITALVTWQKALMLRACALGGWLVGVESRSAQTDSLAPASRVRRSGCLCLNPPKKKGSERPRPFSYSDLGSDETTR